MSRRGQIVVLIAVLIPLALLFLAVAGDGGRLYAEKARLERARQTAMAGTPSPAPPLPSTPLPSPDDVLAWLTDDDRATLVSAPLRATAQAVALAYAARNGIDISDHEILEIDVVYPQSGFNPYDASFSTLRLKLLATRRTRILLAGLLGREFVELSGEAVSELQVR